MPLHDDLLGLAVRLVTPPPLKSEAELRRAVSTAYYALFHLLIDAATNRGVATVALRVYVARNFEHRSMRTVCDRYTSKLVGRAGQPVPAQLRRIADAFVQLQEARHRADYNVKDPVTPSDAQAWVQVARKAFADWGVISANVSTDVFLTELLVGGIKDR